MEWNDVRYVLALARHGSVRAAGASLGVSHSTVARRIEGLESQLAARLFDRTRDGYALTDAGRTMLAGAERVEREMAELERVLVGRDQRLSGPVSLTCCDEFIGELILRELTPFCATYPDIELQITTDSRAFDLTKREADIAIRILGVGAKPPEFLIGVRLLPVTLANYVSIEHAHRVDPEIPGSQPRWLATSPRSIPATLAARSSYPDLPMWGEFSSLTLLVNAALHGLGITMLPTYVGDAVPGLRRLARPDTRHVADLWVLSHPDLRRNTRLREARARVADGLRRHRALFCGTGWSTDATACPEDAPSATEDHPVR